MEDEIGNISIDARSHEMQSEFYMRAMFNGGMTASEIYKTAAVHQEFIDSIAFCYDCKDRDRCQVRKFENRIFCYEDCDTCAKKCRKPCKRFIKFKEYIHKDDEKEY